MMKTWMITGLTMGWVICAHAAMIDEAAFETLGPSLLSAFTGYVEEYMTGERHELQTLADTQTVQSGDWLKMQTLLKKYARTGRSALVWFAHPDGSYYTTEKDKVSANLSDRAYFPGLIQGSPVMGFPIIGKTSGKKSLVVGVPVERDGEIIGALGSSLYLDDLDAAVTQTLNLPENVAFYALGKDGDTLLNSNPGRLFVDPRSVNNPSLAEAVDTMLKQDCGIVTYELDGHTKKAIYKRSEALGWCFALAVETASSCVEGDPMVKITTLPFDGNRQTIMTAISKEVSTATGLPETFVTYYWQTFDEIYCPGCQKAGIETVVFIDLYTPAFMTQDERRLVMTSLADAIDKHTPFSKKDVYLHTHIAEKDQLFINGGIVTNWVQVGGPDENQ